WWLWGVRQEMSRIGAQVFHGTDFSVPYTRSVRSVMTIHDLSPWRYPEWQPGAGRVRRRMPHLLKFGLVSRVITPTHAIRREVIDYLGFDSAKVTAIPEAASDCFRPLPAAPPPVPYLLFVGTLEPRKNVARLVEAWREVRKQVNIDLKIV